MTLALTLLQRGGMLPSGYSSRIFSAHSLFSSTVNYQGCLAERTVDYDAGEAGGVGARLGAGAGLGFGAGAGAGAGLGAGAGAGAAA